MTSGSQTRSFTERRWEHRLAGGGFPLLSPPGARIVDCASRGLGIETSTHLAVGRLTSVNVFLPAGEMILLGRVSWARLVGNRRVGENESRPIYRVGIAFSEGQSFDAWDGLVSRLLSPAASAAASEPKRRVIRWRGR